MLGNRAAWQGSADLQAAGKSDSTDAGRTHRKRLSKEKWWFLGRHRPVAASAECFVYGFGLTRNPFQCFSTTAVLTAGKVLLWVAECGWFWTPNGQNLCLKEHGVCKLLFSVQTGLSKKPGFLTGLCARCRTGARFPSRSFTGLLAGVLILCRWSLQMSAAADDNCLKWTQSH